MSDRAVIEAELQGTGKVVTDAKKIGSALKDSKKEGEGAKASAAGAKGEVRGLGQEVDSFRKTLDPRALLGGVIGGGLVAGLSMLVGYLSQASQKAREFGEQSSATARRAGIDVGQLRQSYLQNELATLQSAQAQDALVQEVQKLTYGGKGASESLEGLGKVATASGRSLQEYAPLVASLQDGIGIVGNVSAEVERLIEQARRLNVIGGPDAFLDTIAVLRPALAEVAQGADQGARKLMALAAVTSQRMRPDQARSAVGGAEAFIKSRVLDVERVLGRQVLGADGRIQDPVRIMKELRARAVRNNGGSAARTRAGLMHEWGVDGGNMLYHTDFAKVEEEALRQDRAATEQAFQSFLKTPEGQRAAREAREGQRDLKAGGAYQDIKDAAGQAKEQAIEALQGNYQSATTMADQPRQLGPAGDPLAPDLQQLGQGIKLEFPKDMTAKEIGREVAAALRAQPPQVRLPLPAPDPNAPKGN